MLWPAAKSWVVFCSYHSFFKLSQSAPALFICPCWTSLCCQHSCSGRFYNTALISWMNINSVFCKQFAVLPYFAPDNHFLHRFCRILAKLHWTGFPSHYECGSNSEACLILAKLGNSKEPLIKCRYIYIELPVLLKRLDRILRVVQGVGMLIFI